MAISPKVWRSSVCILAFFMPKKPPNVLRWDRPSTTRSPGGPRLRVAELFLRHIKLNPKEGSVRMNIQGSPRASRCRGHGCRHRARSPARRARVARRPRRGTPRHPATRAPGRPAAAPRGEDPVPVALSQGDRQGPLLTAAQEGPDRSVGQSRWGQIALRRTLAGIPIGRRDAPRGEH